MEPRGFGPIRTLVGSHSRTASHPIKKATLTKLVPPGPRPGREPHATIPPMIPHRPLPGLALLLCLLLAACGTAGPTATPVRNRAVHRVADHRPDRFAPPLRPIQRRSTRRSRSRSGRSAVWRRSRRSTPRSSTRSPSGSTSRSSSTKDNPTELVEANERLLKGLGLIAPDASLEDLYIDLLSSQVAGLYDPDDKQLYVVSRTGGLGPDARRRRSPTSTRTPCRTRTSAWPGWTSTHPARATARSPACRSSRATRHSS